MIKIEAGSQDIFINFPCENSFDAYCIDLDRKCTKKYMIIFRNWLIFFMRRFWLCRKPWFLVF